MSKLWGRTPDHIRRTFAAAAALGLGTHLYMLANKTTNHDDINQMFDASYGIASGRWLLPLIERLDGSMSMPWLLGLLSILCLAGTACLTVSLLEIRRPLWCVLTASLIVTFPPSASTFSYMFSADAYFLGLMLSALGAWAPVRRGRTGSAVGAVSVAMSLGIYQAYLPVTASLMVGALLLETLEGRRSFRELFAKGLRLVGVLAAGLALYLAAVKLTTWNTGLTDYEGISQMGKLSPARLPGQTAQSFGASLAFFWRDEWGCHFGFLKWAFLLSALGTLLLGGLALYRRRPGPARTALALALAAVYPLACGAIYLMVPNGFIHIHMLYGLVGILLLPIALAEHTEALPGEGVHAAVSWLVALTMALASWSYAVTDNGGYLKADLTMRQCASWSGRLLARVESCPGYAPGMDVVLVGSNVREETLSPTPELDRAMLVGIADLGDLRTSSFYGKYLRYYLGFTGPVHTGDSETARRLAAMEEVQAMPLYPRAGSVRTIGGAVVVRLN